MQASVDPKGYEARSRVQCSESVTPIVPSRNLRVREPYRLPVEASRRSAWLVRQVALWLLSIGALLVFAWPAPCRASERATTLTVLVLPMSSRLERALRTALVPWGMGVERVAAERAEAMDGSLIDARALALERSAQAVVWVMEDGTRSSLWVYDARADAAAFRSVPRSTTSKGVERAPSPALAAALALSVKTLLRAQRERDVPGESEVERESDETWERVEWVAPPPSIVPASSVDGPVFIDDGPPEPRARSAWQLGAGIDVRVNADDTAAEPRYRLMLRHAPWADFGDELSAPWLGLVFEAGGSRTIEAAQFRGDYQELAVALALGVSQSLGERWSVALHVAAQLHRSTLSGRLSPDAIAIEETRWSPSVALRPELELALGRFTLAAQPGLGLFLRRQRYEVDGSQVLATRSPWYTFGLGLGWLL